MNVHMHQARNMVGWILGIALFSPFALYFEPMEQHVALPEVTGRVTHAGRPINGMTLCLDGSDGDHSAFSNLSEDGSFRLLNMREGGFGARPGSYRAHLFANHEGGTAPAKYVDPKTSSLKIRIAPGWNELVINLN